MNTFIEVGQYIKYNNENFVFKATKMKGGKSYGMYTNVMGVLYILDEKRRIEHTVNLFDISKKIESGEISILTRPEAMKLIC